MITATGVELRAGARVLIESASFRVARGDRIGLVGRNGAGKTTLTKCLAGEGIPAAGTITRSGEVGYLPQDPRTGDLDVLARDRILAARGLDTVLRGMRENEERMASAQGEARARAMKKYERLETEFLTRGGYAAEAEASMATTACDAVTSTKNSSSVALSRRISRSGQPCWMTVRAASSRTSWMSATASVR